MKKILILITIVFSVISFSLITANITNAQDAKTAVCQGAGLTVNSNSCDPPAGSPDVNLTVGRALNLFSAIIGIIAVVMIMYGGLKFITSSGDSNAASSARNTIIYAAIGLVVVALAQFIVRFVLARFQ